MQRKPFLTFAERAAERRQLVSLSSDSSSETLPPSTSGTSCPSSGRNGHEQNQPLSPLQRSNAVHYGTTERSRLSVGGLSSPLQRLERQSCHHGQMTSPTYSQTCRMPDSPVSPVSTIRGSYVDDEPVSPLEDSDNVFTDFDGAYAVPGEDIYINKNYGRLHPVDPCELVARGGEPGCPPSAYTTDRRVGHEKAPPKLNLPGSPISAAEHARFQRMASQEKLRQSELRAKTTVAADSTTLVPELAHLRVAGKVVRPDGNIARARSSKAVIEQMPPAPAPRRRRGSSLKGVAQGIKASVQKAAKGIKRMSREFSGRPISMQSLDVSGKAASFASMLSPTTPKVVSPTIYFGGCSDTCPPAKVVPIDIAPKVVELVEGVLAFPSAMQREHIRSRKRNPAGIKPQYIQVVDSACSDCDYSSRREGETLASRAFKSLDIVRNFEEASGGYVGAQQQGAKNLAQLIRPNVLELKPEYEAALAHRDKRVKGIWKGFDKRWGPGLQGIIGRDVRAPTDAELLAMKKAGAGYLRSGDMGRPIATVDEFWASEEGRMSVDWSRQPKKKSSRLSLAAR